MIPDRAPTVLPNSDTHGQRAVHPRGRSHFDGHGAVKSLSIGRLQTVRKVAPSERMEPPFLTSENERRFQTTAAHRKSFRPKTASDLRPMNVSNKQCVDANNQNALPFHLDVGNTGRTTLPRTDVVTKSEDLQAKQKANSSSPFCDDSGDNLDRTVDHVNSNNVKNHNRENQIMD